MHITENTDADATALALEGKPDTNTARPEQSFVGIHSLQFKEELL